VHTKALVVASLVCLLPFTLPAQESPVPFPAGAPAAFEFSFSNPGARSLGLGGAFVALADDATAAFANPAGLARLEAPEVSIEGRYWRYSTPYIEGGRLSGEPTGTLLDTRSEIYWGDSDEEVTDVSFASFVYPKDRWSLALYHHRQIDYQARFQTNGLFGEQALPPFTPRHPDYRYRNDSLIRGNGVSLGFQVFEGLSVGVGAVHFDAELTNYSEFHLPAAPLPEDVYGPSAFSPATVFEAFSMNTDDTDWGFNAGVLWQPSELWGLGAFYRDGADFDVSVSVVSGPALPGPPPGTVLYAVDIEPMEFPDVYGLGVAYQSAGGAATAGLEWDHVGYSSILDSFERYVGSTGANLDDADEYHFGFEYALLEAQPVIALRAGAWLDPDHRIRGRGDSDREYLGALFPRGDDEWHWSAGVGAAFEHVQVDLAADLSDQVDTVSLSAIYTF